jgi:hypothetical protein
MKLSANTLEILKNFSTINQGISVKAGSSVGTVSNIKTVLGMATVEEKFPKDFAIYDLNKFLAKHSLYGDCELDFQEDRVVFVSSDKKRSDYIRYCSPTLITTIPATKSLAVDHPDYSFELTQKDLDWQRKSAGISGSPNFVFRSDGKKIQFVSTDIKDDSSDVSSTTIGDGDGATFEIVMKVEYFKMLDGDYQIDIAKKGLAKFTNKNKKVVYYIAIESLQSTFG